MRVYQDCSLELNASTSKMLLFDDCEKLLECRILKKDQQVSCGESLTFISFLVDVNEAHSVDGDRKPVPGFDSRAKDEKRAKPFVISSSEFNSRGLHKYGAGQSGPETTNTTKTEWQVLYTTQLTQKAKKYHGGFLQFSTFGSYRKQIRLLDASRNQLDCRFLKKDEVVASGESIRLDAHLVEIGEREGDRKPVADLRTRENNAEAGIKLEQGSGAITDKAAGKGCIFELPKYLVEVGGPYPSSGEGEGKSDDKDCLKKASNSNHSIPSVEETKPGRAVPTNKPLRDGERRVTWGISCSKFIDCIDFKGAWAHQILSILQKPMAQESKISGHDNNSTARPVPTAKGSQVLDAMILDSSEAGQPSQSHRTAVKIEPSEKMDTGKPPDLISN